MNIVSYRKIYFIFSGTLAAVSIVSLFLWKLNPGIDFTGGSLMEIEYKNQRPSNTEIQETLKEFNLGDIIVQPSGEKSVILRFKDIEEKTHQDILQKLEAGSNKKQESRGITVEGGDNLEEKKFDSIGPVIGAELKRKAFTAIVWVLVLILAYVAWAFRKVSGTIASWKYGLIAVLTLFHDVLITVGAFSVLGHFYNIEVGLPFVAAILTVLGYSVNDTIVVFDRIRENILKSWEESFESVVNKSIIQTFFRSLNTSLTTLLTLFAIYFFGGETIRWFVLALIIGISFGTYSSIFIASPLLVVWEKLKRR